MVRERGKAFRFCFVIGMYILVLPRAETSNVFQEEKQRARLKEKLDKCIKEKLIFFCDVLDIPVNRSNIKKVSNKKM